MKKTRYLFHGALALIVTGCASNKVDVDSVGGLREANATIQLAKQEGASKHAPETLKKAEETLDHAATVMHENKDMNEATRQTEDAKLAARRALILTRESKDFSEMGGEATALWVESRLALLRKPLGQEDTRSQRFDQQFAALHSTIQQTVNLSAQAKELQGQTAAGQRTIAGLQKEKEFNQRFNNARGHFEENEAEVFRAGNNLVIRLKSMEFPSGKADVAPKNYPLLTKVQKTIKEFGEPSVVIEGHTDAVGSFKKNKDLSVERAENIKEYLVANNTISTDKVEIRGMGSEKPIASNKTPAGRAQNRRIDIVIAPTAQDAE